jgi:hypothetical protein
MRVMKKLANAMLDGANNRMSTAAMLRPSGGTMSGEQQAANNGAGSPQGLALDAKHLGMLMRQNRQLKIGFLSSGGWIRTLTKAMSQANWPTIFTNLTNTLMQLREAFSEPQ